jgi:ABC-type hemin transport system substrate-binding protein
MPHTTAQETLTARIDEVRARRTSREAAEAAAFRAAIEQRLRALERDLGEVKSRVNGLLFLVAGTVLTQVVLRLAHW